MAASPGKRVQRAGSVQVGLPRPTRHKGGSWEKNELSELYPFASYGSALLHNNRLVHGNSLDGLGVAVQPCNFEVDIVGAES